MAPLHDGTVPQYATSVASKAIGRQNAAAYELTGMVMDVTTTVSHIETLSLIEEPVGRNFIVRHLDTTGTATKDIGTSAGRPTIETTAESSRRIGRGTGMLRSLATRRPWPMKTVGLSNDLQRVPLRPYPL